MPRYFFNVYDGQDILDQVGTLLPGPKEVRQHIVSVAMGHLDKLIDHTETWQMEALDEDGKIVGTMDFGIEDDRHRPA